NHMKLVKRMGFAMGLITALAFFGLKDVQAQPTIYLVRHAEKLANWPSGQAGHFQPLSVEGMARAKRLADRFEKGSLTAIYSSLTTRTLHTAFPVSEKLGIPIQIANACMDTSAIDTFLAEIGKNYSRNDAVLLVAHSNIVPYLLVKSGLSYGCRDQMGIIQTSASRWLLIEGYDHLWRIDSAEIDGESCSGFRRLKFE
ncbi:histidine phosphatase family protein, partial [bacterium]|nr:histidine phosphatase family protein [bacterium]